MLEAKGLVKTYKGRVRALAGVSFALGKGETLGVVGESGSGKSTLAKIALRLIEPDAGEVFFRGERVTGKSERALRDFRRNVQIVFQDPYLSLDPRQDVRAILEEPLRLAGMKHRETLARRTVELLETVELEPRFLARRPRELSGGECQRIAIARALAVGPSILVCDEAVSALDVLVRAQILNLLLRLQKERGMSYLFISHDLRVVRHMSDRVLVMKDGEVVETGNRDAIFSSPGHPYTRLLLDSCQGLLR